MFKEKRLSRNGCSFWEKSKSYFLGGSRLMAINVGCEFRGRGSIPSVCQITDADFGQVG